jgi:hypothetical protein
MQPIRKAHAASEGIKRFGLFWWGNGVRLDHWIPDATGTGWQPKTELAPLASFIEDVTVVSGTRCAVDGDTAHHQGRAQILTGTNQRVAEYGASVLPSIDQVIANAWTGLAQYDSLELLVSRRGFENREAFGGVSQRGDGSFTPAETSPAALFDRLFTSALPGDAGAQARSLARISILDAVRGDIERLKPRVSQSDSERLDQHFSAIRGLEERLRTGAGACQTLPERPGTFSDSLGREDLAEVSKAMADLTVLALSCDLTRVVTFEFSQMQCDTVFWQWQHTEGLHTITHRGDDDAVRMAHEAVVYVMEQLAYLVGQLKTTIDDSGQSLLDSMCLMCTSEQAEGYSHSVSDMPVLLIGRAGGALRSGLHYRSPTAENSTNILLTVLHALDQRVAEFGIGDSRSTTPITELLSSG